MNSQFKQAQPSYSAATLRINPERGGFSSLGRNDLPFASLQGQTGTGMNTPYANGQKVAVPNLRLAKRCDFAVNVNAQLLPRLFVWKNTDDRFSPNRDLLLRLQREWSCHFDYRCGLRWQARSPKPPIAFSGDGTMERQISAWLQNRAGHRPLDPIAESSFGKKVTESPTEICPSRITRQRAPPRHTGVRASFSLG